MTDICSVWAYEDIKESGYIGKNQARYLSVFAESNGPLTHREASAMVQVKFDTYVPERNGRIAELEAMGFLKKVDVVTCEFSNKKVNRWEWTGRRTPYKKEVIKVCCEHCHGKGEVEREVYIRDDDRQMKLF